VSGESRIVEQNWTGLFKDWPGEKTPFFLFNVNNNNCEEVAIYLGLVWRLSEGLCRYGIPCHRREDAACALDKVYEPTRWQYEVITEGREGTAEERGFVLGQSSIAGAKTATGSLKNCQGEPGVFEISTFRDLVTLQRATFCDASSEINLFCLKPGRKQSLLTALQAHEKPDLSKLLEPGELFIDLVVGIDRDYYDSVLIKTVSDISERLETFVSSYERSIVEYESRVDSLRSLDEFLSALRLLALERADISVT